MQIWQRNHAGGDITTRVIHVTDTLYHADAVDERERTATLDDRVRATLDLAQARADEMALRHFGHECQPHLCDAWHHVPNGISHGAPYPLPAEAAPPSGRSSNILIVQRGRTAWADFLGRRLGDLIGQMDFQWDRRFRERRRQDSRVPTERRQSDRRGAAPAAWRTLHFALVDAVDPKP